MAACDSCGKTIVWAETPSGAMQPFNLHETDKRPNRVLLHRGPYLAPLALPSTVIQGVDDEGIMHRAGRGESADLRFALFVPHHATCPHADRHRKGR